MVFLINFGIALARQEASLQREAALANAVGEIAALESGHDRLIDDLLRIRIGDPALETVADLDPDLALRRSDDQQQPVIDPLAADAPGAAEAHPVILYRVALERLQ